MDIIQQLQDLKEWSQNRSRYERRMNFRNGQLVQPGPGRPGYSGVKGMKHEKPRQTNWQTKDMTWLTKNQVAAMKKSLPDGISLVADNHIKGQYNYSFSLEKGRGTKNYKNIGKSLRATPENLEKIIEMREGAVKEMFPNRLTNREFKRLRFLPENISKTNEEFAKVLNDLGYKTRIKDGKYGGFTVKDQQIRLGISDDVGKVAKAPRKKSEVLKLIRESSGGKELLQIYNWDKHEKILRSRANAIANQETAARTKGYFPTGNNNEGKLWSSFYRAANQGGRIKIVGEFADGNFPRDADGYVDWWKKDKNGVQAWKKIEFMDMEAPKGKQKFKWGNLKADVDKAFGKGFFARNTKGYDLAALDSERMFKGEKIGTLVRDKMLMKELKNNIFKKEGVKRQPTKLEVDEFMKRRRPSFAMSEGHHVEGIAKNPYKVEPAFRVANRKLGSLERSYKAGNIDKATFIDEIKKLPGGIRYKVDDVLEGVKSTEPKRVKAAVKDAGFNKNTANQIFKAYQAQGIGTKCQWKGNAEGGRIGFAEAGFVDDKCMRNAINEHKRKLGDKNEAAIKKQMKINQTKGLKNMFTMGRKGLQSIISGVGLNNPGALALEAAIEAAFYGYGRQQGESHEQARENLFFPKLLAKSPLWEKLGFKPFKTGVWEGPEKLIEEELLAGNESAQEYAQGIKALEDEYANATKIDFELGILNNQWKPGSEEQIEAKEQELKESYDRIGELQLNVKEGTPIHDSYVAAQEKQKALRDKRAQDPKVIPPSYGRLKERQWRDEFLDYRGAKPKYGQFISSERDPNWKERNPFAFKDQALESSIVDLGSEDRINWDAYKNYGWDKPEQKWKDLYDTGGWDLMDRIGIAGGVANMAGGGIAGIRRPNAIPPKSGPMPQGGGLSSQFNRVKKLTE